MTTVLFVLLAAAEPTGNLKLEAPQLQALRKSAIAMRDAAVANDAKALVATMYPGAIKAMGGEAEARKLVNETMEQGRKGMLQLTSADVAPPHFCTRTPDGGLQCVLKQTNHYLHDGKKLFTVADVIALSADKGATWTFLSASANSIERLRRSMPELSADLPISPQRAPAPEK